MSSAPRIELLWWKGCPSWPQAEEMLRQSIARAGLDPGSVEVREIRTEADAEGEGFVGSPTIRIDGRDLQPPSDDPVGLTCRVYRLRDGRVSPLPDQADLDDALRMASQGGSDG